jgi:hypothetical protein
MQFSSLLSLAGLPWRATRLAIKFARITQKAAVSTLNKRYAGATRVPGIAGEVSLGCANRPRAASTEKASCHTGASPDVVGNGVLHEQGQSAKGLDLSALRFSPMRTVRTLVLSKWCEQGLRYEEVRLSG